MAEKQETWFRLVTQDKPDLEMFCKFLKIPGLDVNGKNSVDNDAYSAKYLWWDTNAICLACEVGNEALVKLILDDDSFDPDILYCVFSTKFSQFKSSSI